MYAIKEIFNTLQGEGSRAGHRSVFVRFAGCNLWNGLADGRLSGRGACAMWCDTDFVGGEKLSIQQILQRVDEAWPKSSVSDYRWVVLTGGEPCLQLDMPLIDAFSDAGIRVAIETNGTLDSPVLLACDHVCVSPKRRSQLKVHRGTELKVVLPGEVQYNDPGWTDEELRALLERTTFKHYFVQPQDVSDPATVDKTYLKGDLVSIDDRAAQWRFQDNMRRCTEVIGKMPQFALSMQTHKYLGLR